MLPAPQPGKLSWSGEGGRLDAGSQVGSKENPGSDLCRCGLKGTGECRELGRIDPLSRLSFPPEQGEDTK